MIPTTVRTAIRCLSQSNFATFTALLLGALMILPAPASAVVNASVRSACMSDYFAYCAGLEVGSKELRRCMSKAGPKLSSSCVSALVAAGEVSRAEVNRRSGKSTLAAASRKARTAAVPGRRSSATRLASRSVCGPARPGAGSSIQCKSSVVASGSRRGTRLIATLR